MPSFGLTIKQIVNYIPIKDSTRENERENALALIENGQTDAFLVKNNNNRLMNTLFDLNCAKDTLCQAYVGLCFSESSQFLLCDENNQVTTEAFAPT